MIVRVEPKDWNMFSVSMLFNKEHPYPEDQAVGDYLADHGLVPKRESETRLEGVDWSVMSFGGCYLGRHLNYISEIQRQAVEREALAAEVGDVLRGTSNDDVRGKFLSLDDSQVQAALTRLVDELHPQASFEADAEGLCKATVDAAAVRRGFLKIAGAIPKEAAPNA